MNMLYHPGYSCLPDEPVEPSIQEGGKENAAILYFFHGADCHAKITKTWLFKICHEHFSFDHIKIIYPEAPRIMYQLNGNREAAVWFDRQALSEDSNEEKESVNIGCRKMFETMEEEVAKGTPYKKIIVGGFSMGGAFALHLAYRFNKPFAGCFAISSFLNHDSLVYEALETNIWKPPLLLMHGQIDCLIPNSWGRKLKKKLEEKGVTITSKCNFHADHEIVKEELTMLKEWVLKILPPT